MGYSLWTKEPDLIDEFGNKWWRDKSFDFLINSGKMPPLENTAVYLIESKDKVRYWVLVTNNEVVFESQRSEDTAAHISFCRLELHHKDKSK